MQQDKRGDFFPPTGASSGSFAPPPVPAHLTLSMQQRSESASYEDQQFRAPPRNPFNDSNLALSHVSTRNSAASVPAASGDIHRGPVGGEAAGAALAGTPARTGNGRRPSFQTPDRNSSYSGYSMAESPVGADPLAWNPALQRGPYAANSSYAGTAHAGPPAFRLSQQGMPLAEYPSPAFDDSPYTRYSSPWDSRLDQGGFNPDEIADDGDDGLNRGTPARRKSLMSFGRSKSSLAAGAAAGAATGGVVDAIRNVSGSNPGGDYGPVPATETNLAYEKSRDLAEEARSRKKKRLGFVVLAVVVLLALVAAAVVGGVIGARNSANSQNPGSGSGGSSQQPSDDLTLNSPQIQQLLNDKNLHRVFPGIDYTPMNAQYPACLTAPPSQDNITMDIAILSQLTKTIRLYGTDCNQTDMILDALDKLQVTDVKLWLGVWLDNNQTTNDRGMSAMWDILGRKGADPFAGVIIGNEVLYRKDMSEQQLGSIVQGVRQNFTAKKFDLPIAVADLGDNWNSALVEDVDVVMSNVHPFFGGVEASAAAEWTWNFWEQHDVTLTQGTSKKNVISETGWPSAGGNDCGTAACTSDTQGSVAGIDGMNTFMNGFVCQSLANSTDYFWFEAFDEPWKVIFNTQSDQWETKWGLMDENRNLKQGVTIPDCGGQTV